MKGLKDLKTGRFVANLKDKKCLVCGKKFHPRFEKTILCGRKCWGKYASLNYSENNASNWQGDKVGYPGLHQWVKKYLGKPKKCENCGTITAKQFDWANKSHIYLRDLRDWIRLCRKCHIHYDKNV